MPKKDSKFDSYGFVGKYRNKFFNISALKEELLKTKRLINGLLEETVKNNYTQFIEFSKIFGEISSKLELSEAGFFERLEEKKVDLQKFYSTECLSKLEECENLFFKINPFLAL